MSRVLRAVLHLAVASCTVAAAMTGCSIDADDAPRDIDRDAPDERVVVQSQGAAATGSGRIFLLAPEVPGLPTRLSAVARDAPEDAAALLAILLAGPNANERGSRLRTALPAGLQVQEVVQRASGVLAVDVSDEIVTLSGDGLIAALAQIVFTVSAISGVESLQLTVDGGSIQWPASNGELTSRPLTVYDYPGWEPSSQPAYPGMPNPTTP